MQRPDKLIWVYDVISPFAYLSFPRIAQLSQDITVEPKPVLFAALLDHFGQLGPAEIAPKRRYTYRYALWRARQLGLPMRFPPLHPFNPLAGLRLILAAGNDLRAAGVVLDAVFREGRDVSAPEVIADLARQLAVADPQGALSDPVIKARLRENTEWAIAHGIFGVPTLVVGEEMFWGQDGLDMGLDYLAHPEAFADPQMRAADTIPQGITRKKAS
jgi:2-hydroxychromene-2-carboxylate isomerase